MGKKVNKRTRKFLVKKASLENPGKQKKGKEIKRQRKPLNKKKPTAKAPAAPPAEPPRDRSNDFVDKPTQPHLNVDDFFAQASAAVEHEMGLDVGDDDDDKLQASLSSEDSDSDDDELEKEEKPKKKKQRETDAKTNNNNHQQKKKKRKVEKDTTTSDDSGDSDENDEEAEGSGSASGSDSGSASGSDSGSNDSEEGQKTTKKKQQKAKKPSRQSADSDDEDDDDEEAKIRKAEESMKEQMAKLGQSDPDFHDFLQANEKSLLEFGHTEPAAADDDDDGAATATTALEKGAYTVHLTEDVLEDMERRVFETHSLKHFKRLLAAYRRACHLADTSADEERRRHGESGIHFVIEASHVFDRLMLTVLHQSHEAFAYWLFPNPQQQEQQEPPVVESKKQRKKRKQKQEAEGEKQPKQGKDDDEDDAGEGMTAGDKATENDGDDSDSDDDTKNPSSSFLEDSNKPIPPSKLEKAKRWPEMRMLLQSFCSSTIHLLQQAKEPELLALVLKALTKYIPLLSPIPHMAELLLRALIDKWSGLGGTGVGSKKKKKKKRNGNDDDNNDEEEAAKRAAAAEYQVVRMQAMFRIRQLAVTQPFPFVETVLRRTYLAYSRRIKPSGESDEFDETLTFLGNSVVELYRLDWHASYQHAFVYIRQLAMQLRTALQKKGADNNTARPALFRWQYLHCLKLWVAVLCSVRLDDKDEEASSRNYMQSLIYPLTEIINGVARMTSGARYLPYRLHCVRLLQQLAAASETFIPTTALLLDCLDWKEWYNRHKKVNGKKGTAGHKPKTVDMLHMVRLPKEDALQTSEQLEAGITQLFVLLEREVNLYRYTAAFPEFSLWIRRRLRVFCRETHLPRWRRFAQGVVDMCETQAQRIAVQRARTLTQAPKDVTILECLRPPATPSMYHRHQRSLEKEQAQRRVTGAAAPRAAAAAAAREREARENDREEEQKEKKQLQEKKAQQKAANQQAMDDGDVLDQDDEVREVVDWSDEDEKDQGGEQDEDSGNEGD